MSSVDEVLKVRRVKQVLAMAELGNASSALNREQELANYLAEFVEKYSVKKTLQGKQISPSQLLNQHSFLNTIFDAQSVKQREISTILGHVQRATEKVGRVSSEVSHIEGLLAEERQQENKARQLQEDSENTDLYNARVKR